METTTENSSQTANESRDLEAQRIAALAKHLGLDNDGADDLEVAGYDDTSIKYGREEYLVLTDEEADDRATTTFRETLWACTPRFLASYVPALRSARVERAWADVMGELSDDANPLVEALLGDRLEEAVKDGLSLDGRGHFLAHYDGAEYDATVDGTTFYIYRTN